MSNRFRLTRRFPKIVTIAAVTVGLSGCMQDAVGPEPSSANLTLSGFRAPPVTLEWQQTARNLVAQNSINPLGAGRLFAAVGIASMLAVEAVDAAAGATGGSGTNSGAVGRSLYEARRGAVAGASARVLGWFVPAAASGLEALASGQANAGPGGVHPHFVRGLEAGRAAGDAMIQRLMSDGFTAAWTGSIPVGDGFWTTTVLPPGGVMLGGVTPYFITSAEQFRPPPPPAYLSPEFNADLEEVLAIRTGLTASQLAIALGWAYGAGTYTPVGYWNELASTYVAADGLDEAAAAKVFGLMSAAVFDGMITGFAAKYYYWTLRPHQANPAITTAFAVPNYPAYPSGHGGVSAASARVLAHFFPARVAELNALVEEAAMSRIYAGIHYRFDMTAARQMAEAVADWVLAQ